MKLIPKNSVELGKMRKAGRLAAEVLDFITPHVQPGVSTGKLDMLCHEFIVKHNAIPAPLNYKGYPKATCISRNEVVCHGIPSEAEILKEGDIINVDITVIVDGFHGDSSRMYAVGSISPVAEKLILTTYDAMMAGIKTVKSGSFLHDIGRVIDTLATQNHYSVVRDYCGHGLGRRFHEDPMVLHYAHEPHSPVRLKNGLCFTIEPMLNIGTWRTVLDKKDGWTVTTADGTLSAQWEHSLAVADNEAEIFTVSPAFGHDARAMAKLV